MSQAALSLIEKGRTALSAAHLENLAARFNGPDYQPTFSEFGRRLQEDAVAGQAALDSPGVRFLTLTVWRWDDAFDLGRRFTPDESAGLVTVRATDRRAIAFIMPQKSAHWVSREILVFEQSRVEDVRDGDVCLVQSALPRGGGTRTAICVAHAAPSKRGRELHLEPLSPAGSFIAATPEGVRAIFRVTFRGRYCE